VSLLKKTEKISLATDGERFTLAGGSLYFGGGEIYTFETNIVDMKSFFQEAFSGAYEIIGYDLKKDLERIEAYLEGTMTEKQNGQMGLF